MSNQYTPQQLAAQKQQASVATRMPHQIPPNSAHIDQNISPRKLTPVGICRQGQDLVQDIVYKFYELLTILKQMQLPNSQNMQVMQDKKAKLEDLMNRTVISFQKLHFVHDSICNLTKNIEHKPIMDYLPIGDAYDTSDETLDAEHTPEEAELIQQIRGKNQHIKQVIDHMRTTLWNIDTMLANRN